MKWWLLLGILFAGEMALGQLIGNKHLYAEKVFEAGNVKVRMVVNYEKISPKMEFYVLFYFDLNTPWIVYSMKESTDHKPLSVVMELPEGFKVIERFEDIPEEEKYEGDFCIVYKIRSPETLNEEFRLSAQICWQSCDDIVCTFGEVRPELSLSKGKVKKSRFYKDIEFQLKKMRMFK